MLVLTRKAAQKIHIGSDITVTILRVQGQAVKVGIEAPNGIQVLRNDLIRLSELADTEDANDEMQVCASPSSPIS